MGIKRTVSIRLIQLWLLNQWFLLILQRKMQKTKLSNFPLGNPFINLKCFVAILNDWIFGRNFQDILFGSKIMGKNISHNFFCKNQILNNPSQTPICFNNYLFEHLFSDSCLFETWFLNTCFLNAYLSRWCSKYLSCLNIRLSKHLF